MSPYIPLKGPQGARIPIFPIGFPRSQDPWVTIWKPKAAEFRQSRDRQGVTRAFLGFPIGNLGLLAPWGSFKGIRSAS